MTTTPKDAPDWRGMTQAARDAGFNNVNAVPDALAIVADWDRRSAALRAAHPTLLDLRYGPRERNRIDVFKVADDAPTLVFIHGGYWQTRAKETFAVFAEGPMAHGINVALIGYTLAPDATMDEIVGEIYAALDYLAAHLPEIGCDTSQLVLSGWSAGGHMTAMALAHPAVKAGMAISGLYDLKPIRHSYLNDKLQLDEPMSRRNSPLLQNDGPNKPLAMVCGATELPLLRIQSAAFAGHRASLGLPVSYEEIAGANHFSIMAEMAKPDGRITTLIRNLFARVG
jgi:arylformamidase